jgi:hypothetical protein
MRSLQKSLEKKKKALKGISKTLIKKRHLKDFDFESLSCWEPEPDVSAL